MDSDLIDGDKVNRKLEGTTELLEYEGSRYLFQEYSREGITELKILDGEDYRHLAQTAFDKSGIEDLEIADWTEDDSTPEYFSNDLGTLEWDFPDCENTFEVYQEIVN